MLAGIKAVFTTVYSSLSALLPHAAAVSIGLTRALGQLGRGLDNVTANAAGLKWLPEHVVAAKTSLHYGGGAISYRRSRDGQLGTSLQLMRR